MKLRILIISLTAFYMISSCSSCSENKGSTGNNRTTSSLDGTNSNLMPDDHTQDGINRSEVEKLQVDMNDMIEEQITLANSSRSNRVETIIASFELGMTKREVKKHMLRMKQKKHLVRIQKSAKVFEYVYQLRLASGKSNTYMDFEYDRKGGVYKAICKPSKSKKRTKSKFLAEVKDLLIDWYGPYNFQLPTKKGCERYVWITGNRHLDLYCTSQSVEFVYTDLNVEIPPNIDDNVKERPDVVM